MIWPFTTSNLLVEELKQREDVRKERDRLLGEKTVVLQSKLQDALRDLTLDEKARDSD